MVLYKEKWPLSRMSEEDRQTREAIRQFYRHTLVQFDEEMNRWLGLPVVQTQWLCEPPDWEELYRARVQGRPSAS